MNYSTIAGAAGRIAGRCYVVARLIDWREVGAIVWHGLIVLAVMTWHAGRETGRAVHCANDALAALWRRLWVPPVVSPPEAPAQPLQRLTVAVPVAIHPLAELAAELESLSCRQLRTIGGIRARRSKQQLIAAICAV
jgi:hypothetical protein